MSLIYYAVNGEGRGHATRARTIIEELRKDHKIVVYTHAYAYELLSPLYKDSDIEIRETESLRWYYTKSGSVSPTKTVLGGIKYLTKLKDRVDRVVLDMEKEKPDLALVDFEPVLPRAAERVGVPYISIDHQHFLVVHNFSDLPLKLRCYAEIMGKVVKQYYSKQEEIIVSSFFSPPLKWKYIDVVQAGVLLRPEVRNATPELGKHVVSYLRNVSTPRNVMEALRSSKHPVKIYGMGNKGKIGNLEFKSIDPLQFVEDLATCKALVANSGNQLMGEALYLGKPIYAFPEPGNQEQALNAWYLNKCGFGKARDAKAITSKSLRKFLIQASMFTDNINEEFSGNDKILEAIKFHL